MSRILFWQIIAGIGGALVFFAGIWALWALSVHVFLWTAWVGLVLGLTVSCIGVARMEADDRK